MFKTLLRFRAAFLLLGSLLLSVMSYGQGVTTSSINGVITDDKGEALPGATVVAVHTPSGSRYGITTNAQGRYTFPAVRIGGPYQITVSFVGFQEQKRDIVSAELNTPVSANFKLLEEGKQLTEVVITSSRGSIIDSERNGTSTNISRQSFERLPTLSRSFTDFSTLTPQAGPGFSFGGRSALYNNFSIDGSTANNVFGLNALPGGQANATPVSIDAIEQLNVSISPFDVTQGSFTGAGVNAVTRSGTNRFEGSGYYFLRNQSFVGTKVGDVDVPAAQRQDFSFYNTGIRLGGPIIKNKLFFFVNAEQEQRSSPAVLFPVGGSLNNVAFQQTQQSAELTQLRTFLTTPNNGKTWTFDPGTLDNFNALNQSLKFLAKIDWNISDQHKFTIRYNQLNSYADIPPSNSGSNGVNPPTGRQNNVNTIPFSGTWYRINNNLQSIIGELNSTFGNKFANNLQVGYTAFRDFRQAGGGAESPNFPTVDIAGTNGNTLTSFGAEPFTPNNVLNQDVIQINDRFDMFLGKHTVSVGTANEIYAFENGFTPAVRSIYTFNSVADFIGNATAPTTANAPAGFTVLYSAIPGTPVPIAKFSASQLGFYAQDAFNLTPRVRVTAGLRVDVPVFNNTGLIRNTAVDEMKFTDNTERIDVSKLPNSNLLWSPRVGVNWDVFGDRSLQVRGGTGIFTGRVPFVWISNQISNNGVLFGTIARTTQQTNANLPFSPDPAAYVPTSLTGAVGTPLAPNFSINATTPDFKFPQVWRTSIGVDKSLGNGWVATFDGIYTKDVNAVFIRDANLANAGVVLGGDGRPVFGGAAGTAAVPPFDRRVNDRIVQALVLDNTNRGYALSLTAQVQKRFARGFEGSLAYTYTESKDINAQGASTAGTLFTGQSIVGSPNSPNLANANNLVPHRVVGYVQYRKEYLKNFATTLALTYTGQNVFNFSYSYIGSPNSDGINGNDLIYVPRNQNEILLTTTNAQDGRTTQQIWEQLNAYIEQDPYLSTRRGQYAERNGAYAPWQNLLNLRVLQDIYISVGERRHTLQLSADMVNVLNFIDPSLGLAQTTNRTALLNFVGYETPYTATTTSNTGRPIYSFAEAAPGQALTSTFVNNFNLASRWQLQLGARYIF